MGWEVELSRNGKVDGVRRFVLHAEAVADAEQVKSDCEQGGLRKAVTYSDARRANGALRASIG
jgi:hypothetical protein